VPGIWKEGFGKRKDVAVYTDDEGEMYVGGSRVICTNNRTWSIIMIDTLPTIRETDTKQAASELPDKAEELAIRGFQVISEFFGPARTGRVGWGTA
jgi:hypothetical protein